MKEFKESDSSFYDNEYFLGLEFRYFSGAHENKPKTLFSLVGDIKNKKILDLGCGGGLFSKLATEKGAKVLGVDYSEQAIDFASKRYPEIKFKVGSAYDLNFLEEDSFDVVFLMDIIEHLSDQRKCLNEVFRVLKAGGLLVVSTDLDDTYWNHSLMKRFIWFSMRFSKQGRAYKLIKSTESKIRAKKRYHDSHIGLLSFNNLEDLVVDANFKMKKHRVYPLVAVWWRDFIFSFLPKRIRGEHQMVLAKK